LSRGGSAGFFTDDLPRTVVVETGQEIHGRENAQEYIAALHTVI
jgi:hypothetical protein